MTLILLKELHLTFSAGNRTLMKECFNQKQKVTVKTKGENKMKTKEELKNYLLENYVDENGDLILSNLDFNDFEGDVYINNMKVKGRLFQNGQKVQGDLYQHEHEVRGHLQQYQHVVQGNLYQSGHEAHGSLYQSGHEVQRNLYQSNSEAQGSLCNENNKYGELLDENQSTKLLKEKEDEEAQNYLREIGFLTEMKVDFKDNSDDVNWEDDDQRKYSLRFDHYENIIAVAWCYSGQHQGTLYTTNREWLEQYIEENRYQIKEYCFGIK